MAGWFQMDEIEGKKHECHKNYCPHFVSPVIWEDRHEKNVRVRDVIVCYNALASIQSSYSGGQKKSGFAKHDFVVVRVILPNGSVKWIKAEKMGENGSRRAGIYLSMPENREACTGKYQLENCRDDVLVEMRHLFEFLGGEDTNYNLVDNNCWRYAYRTGKKLINEFAPDSTKLAEKVRLKTNGKRYLLPRAELPTLFNIVRVLLATPLYIYNGMSEIITYPSKERFTITFYTEQGTYIRTSSS